MKDHNVTAEPWKLSLRTVLISVAAIVMSTIIYGVAVVKVYPDPGSRGTFGDMFGALNALFAGLAFLGVVAAIYLQQIELRAQQVELRQAREAHEASARALEQQLKASESSARIQGLNLLIETTRKRLEGLHDPSNVPELERRKHLLRQLATYEEDLAKIVAPHTASGEAP